MKYIVKIIQQGRIGGRIMAKKKTLWIVGVGLLLVICAMAVFFYQNKGKKSQMETKSKKQSVLLDKQILEPKGVLCDYRENSDGTWSADGRIYQHKVMLTGKLPSAEGMTTYIVLTNDENITFEEVGKSFYSSNSADLLNPEKACVVQWIEKDE